MPERPFDLPHESGFDHTHRLLREGYRFLPDRFRRFGSDLFTTRLMTRRAICAGGEDAARMFYAPDRFTRRGALPPTTLLLLQGPGSVQTLDGAAHRHRKQMFLSLMTPEKAHAFGEMMEAVWRARMPAWQQRDVVLLNEVRAILTRAVCSWAGVKLDERAAVKRTKEFGAMVEGAGAVGPRNWRGLLLRARTSRWARDLIDRVRAGEIQPPADSALAVIAAHRDLHGQLLNRKVAATELINVLRPTVAADRFAVFAALALHLHPEWQERLRTGDAPTRHAFAEEVRRFYPFFPAVGGRVRNPFIWRRRYFGKGTWVVLDLYGTNHDPRSWRAPESFAPERFLEGEANGFNFVPQGGGDAATGHRCPGEAITLEVIERTVWLLATAMRYQVPQQDLTIDLGRMPAIPRSRFVMRGIELVSAAPGSGTAARDDAADIKPVRKSPAGSPGA